MNGQEGDCLASISPSLGDYPDFCWVLMPTLSSSALLLKLTSHLDFGEGYAIHTSVILFSGSGFW